MFGETEEEAVFAWKCSQTTEKDKDCASSLTSPGVRFCPLVAILVVAAFPVVGTGATEPSAVGTLSVVPAVLIPNRSGDD